MKYILFFEFFCCIIFMFGCNNKEISKENNSNPKIIFLNNITIDKKVLSFFESYLNDTILKDTNNFFLFVFQRNDTTLVDINVASNYIYSMGNKPYGLIKYHGKNIFIMNNNYIFNIKKNDELLSLEQSMKMMNKNKDFYKHWLLVIDNFTDESIIIKNELDITSTILGIKVIDSPIKFDINTNRMDTIP